VKALAIVGGRSAVQPLHAMNNDRAMTAELRAAAGDAMTAIRARLGGGQDGRLSLAGEEADSGGLSLAEDDEAPPDVDTFSGRS
jgi:hypothetical protein